MLKKANVDHCNGWFWRLEVRIFGGICEISKNWLVKGQFQQNAFASLAGFEPATFGLEVQRAIHCATGTASGNALDFNGFVTGAWKSCNFSIKMEEIIIVLQARQQECVKFWFLPSKKATVEPLTFFIEYISNCTSRSAVAYKRRKHSSI